MSKVKSLRLYTLHFTLYVSKNREKVYVVCVEKSRKGVTFLGLGMGCNENKVPLNETLCYDG